VFGCSDTCFLMLGISLFICLAKCFRVLGNVFSGAWLHVVCFLDTCYGEHGDMFSGIGNMCRVLVAIVSRVW